MTTASPPETAVGEFPIRRVRFVNGRTHHRTRRPAEWHHLLEAACGKSGYLAT